MTTLEKIRAEIGQDLDTAKNDYYEFGEEFDNGCICGLEMSLKVIDKYAEQEPKITTTSTDEPMVIQYPQVDGITPTLVFPEEYTKHDMWIGEKQEPCDDAVSRQAVDELSKELVHTTRDKADFLCNFWEGLQKLPPVRPQEPKWIPMTTRPMTEEEREHYREWSDVEWSDVDEAMIFDCELPEDGQEVLVSHCGYVCVDTFCTDDGCYFEGIDIDDVDAWMPLPKPYKAESGYKE